MSVVTSADEHFLEFKRSIDTAVFHMKCIYIDRCWGWDAYKLDFIKNLFNGVVEIRNLFTH